MSHCETSIRFGFDPKTDDYKLVKIPGIRNNYFSVKRWLEVEVYSMRKGSWEFITQPFPSHITQISNNDGLCVDGHDGHLHWEATIGHHSYLHWQCIAGSSTKRTIVAFDLCLKTFHEIPLPDSILDSKHGKHRLRVLGGKLCVMTWQYDGAWEVWVMEEYGVPESWVKRHVFSQFIDDWKFLYGFTSRNDLLLLDKEDRLVMYDPVANNTKSTHTSRSEVPIIIVEYVDSLVWIKNFRKWYKNATKDDKFLEKF